MEKGRFINSHLLKHATYVKNRECLNFVFYFLKCVKTDIPCFYFHVRALSILQHNFQLNISNFLKLSRALLPFSVVLKSIYKAIILYNKENNNANHL